MEGEGVLMEGNNDVPMRGGKDSASGILLDVGLEGTLNPVAG